MAIPLLNSILAKQYDDNLYHFGLARSVIDFEKQFGDVRVNLLLLLFTYYILLTVLIFVYNFFENFHSFSIEYLCS